MTQVELPYHDDPRTPKIGSAEHRRRGKRNKNHVLTKLQKARKELISMASTVAVRLCDANGEVTGIQVREEMTKRGYRNLMEQEVDGKKIDPRWMGAVFGKHSEVRWEFVRFDTLGSHSSPVRVWRLAP
jgi:hypothetical protein